MPEAYTEKLRTHGTCFGLLCRDDVSGIVARALHLQCVLQAWEEAAQGPAFRVSCGMRSCSSSLRWSPSPGRRVQVKVSQALVMTKGPGTEDRSKNWGFANTMPCNPTGQMTART